MKQTALNSFIESKAAIDEMLAKLTALSDDHFDVSPDDVNWGHAGTLAHYRESLREICEAAVLQ